MARIAAVVATRLETVGGGAPVFLAENRQKLEETAFLLEKLLDCAAHELREDLFLLVDRSGGNG